MKKFIKKSTSGLILGIAVLGLLLSTLIVPAQPVRADARSDIFTYNSLIGFSKICGFEGGSDNRLKLSDIDQIYDGTGGGNDDAKKASTASVGWREEDDGMSLIRGFFDSPDTNGMGTCNGVSIRVAAAIIRNQEVDLEIPGTAEAAKKAIASMVIDGKDATLEDPFRGGNTELITIPDNGWQTFVDDMILPTAEIYKERLGDVDTEVIAAMLIPAMNYCYLWTDNQDDLTADGLDYGSHAVNESAGLFGDAGVLEGGRQRLYSVAGYNPSYWTHANTGSNSSIATHQLDYRDGPEFNHRWYSFGYAAVHMLDGVTPLSDKYGGLLRCSDIERSFENMPGLAESFTLDGESGRLKLTDEADTVAVGEGIDFTVTGNEDGQPVDNAQNCKGGTGLIDGFLGFIICPFVEMVLGIIHWAETNIIIPFLAINPLEADDTTADGDGVNTVYQMWKVVRNVANVLIVLGFLFLIYTQTTSFDVNAYQVKRLAPRLLIMAIATNLSFQLAAVIIDIFNVIGASIGSLTAVLISQDPNASLVTVEGGAALVGQIGFLATTGAVGLVALLLNGSLAAPIMLLGVVSGLFAMFAVAITLVLRQIAIVGLVIVAPLAFAASLLPNTEDFYKRWQSFFIKLLAMYPLIIGLFALGKIFGTIATQANSGGAGSDAVASFLGFIANIAPMFLIPFTFKFAGSAVGTLYGALTNARGKAKSGIMGSEHDPGSFRNLARSRSRGKWAARQLSGGRVADRTMVGRGLKRIGAESAFNRYSQTRGKLRSGAKRAVPFRDLLDRTALFRYGATLEDAEKIVALEKNNNSAEAYAHFAAHGGSTRSFNRHLRTLEAAHEQGLISDEVLEGYRGMRQYAGDQQVARAAVQIASAGGKLKAFDDSPSKYIDVDGERRYVGVAADRVLGGMAGFYQDDNGNWQGEGAMRLYNTGVTAAQVGKTNSPHLAQVGVDSDGTLNFASGTGKQLDLQDALAYNAVRIGEWDWSRMNDQGAAEMVNGLSRVISAVDSGDNPQGFDDKDKALAVQRLAEISGTGKNMPINAHTAANRQIEKVFGVTGYTTEARTVQVPRKVEDENGNVVERMESVTKEVSKPVFAQDATDQQKELFEQIHESAESLRSRYGGRTFDPEGAGVIEPPGGGSDAGGPLGG